MRAVSLRSGKIRRDMGVRSTISSNDCVELEPVQQTIFDQRSL
jgi:hypothetical protein